MTTPAPVKIISCKYECGTKLGDFDQDAHKYKEVVSGELHTMERCQAAKATRAQKDDHGNELTVNVKEPGFSSNAELNRPVEHKTEYVDHTLAKPSEVKIFFSQYPADVEKEYKSFQIGKKFAWTRAQYQLERDEDNKILFTICFFYEEKV